MNLYELKSLRNGWFFISIECKKLKAAEEQRKCGGSPDNYWSLAEKDFEIMLGKKLDCRRSTWK